ncbi:gamma-butyrobetaine hydroxylase-like domain-containing protein [Aquabacterium sp.]|uniref:gamma-butyrobetaine hydroxylase-like domain-containing protein n=1 Tax=Aquabacterium sp. TaxID=1872578 RepID=UPI003784F970
MKPATPTDADMLPQQVILHEVSGHLTLAWADLGRRRLGGPQLRAACRCAGCEHARRRGRLAAPQDDTRLAGLQPIGEFGLQLQFSDGHERGIFPWAYLRELAQRTESETA